MRFASVAVEESGGSLGELVCQVDIILCGEKCGIWLGS